MAVSGGREKEEEAGNYRRPDSDGEVEYTVESVRERITSSRGSRFNLIQTQLRIDQNRRRFSRENLINGIKCLVILPDSRFVRTSISKLFSINSQNVSDSPLNFCILAASLFPLSFQFTLYFSFFFFS